MKLRIPVRIGAGLLAQAVYPAVSGDAGYPAPKPPVPA